MNFILMGMGYVSRKHLQAIKDVGGKLLAFYEPCHENVGFIQEYFDYDIPFFKELERLDRFVYKQQANGVSIDYCSILSPNYLHEPQARWAMRSGMNCIVEKPVSTMARNMDALKHIESETGKRVFAVLQLRLHDNTKSIVDKCANGYHKVKISYSTWRTSWYFNTWKNDESKSGSLIVNIGIHLVDLASYLFGKCYAVNVSAKEKDVVSGSIEFERAHVDFTLSIKAGEKPQRIFEIDGEQLEFSNKFKDLHTEIYKEILNGNGYGIDDARESIKICEMIRHSRVAKTY